MNKTIIININGIIFHIEEDAYEVLQTYMTAVKRHFGYSADSNEIVGDIENRIAEMFGERITPQKAVITMQDVTEVTAQMGDISDFEAFDETNAEATAEDFDTKYQGERYSDAKGLFRDPDDKVIGGVCSGLGHYFDIGSKWIRLALILLFLFAGTGLLLYIILWIMMPLARTRADKMSMRGEAANLHNFKRSFDEEMEGLRRNFSRAGQNISPGLKNTAKKTGDALDKIIRIVVKIIGIFVVITTVLFAVGLVTALVMFLGRSNGGFITDYFPPIHFIDPAYYTTFIWACFLAIAIPLIALFLISIKMISGIRTSKYLGYSLLIAWIISMGFVIYYVSIISFDHAMESSVTESSSITPQNVYYLSINDVGVLSKNNDSVGLNGEKFSNRITIKRGLSILEIRPDIYVNKLIQGSAPIVSKEFTADGRNFTVATERAQRINYNVVQKGQSLVFDSHATIGKDALYRDQEVRVDLNIPPGTRLVIDNKMRNRLQNVSFEEFYEDYEDQERPAESEWVMTDNGLVYINRSQRLPVPDNSNFREFKTDSVNTKTDSVLKK